MTRGPLIDAMEEDMRSSNRDHDSVVTLLQSGYQPSGPEWAAYRRAPMGSEADAATLKRRAILAKAWLRYREMRADGFDVEECLIAIMREFNLSRDAAVDYAQLGKDTDVVDYAKRHQKACETGT